LLENLTIGGAGEEPEPGNDFGAVRAETIVATCAGEAADIAIPKTLIVTVEMDADGYLLADDVLEGDGVAFRQEVDGEMEKMRNGLRAGQVGEKKSVFAERRVDLEQVFFLGVFRHFQSPRYQKG
jgi:hypothetical protein